MKYQIKGDYLIIEINDDFAGMSVEQFFNYFHLSRKTIHLLKQNKQYALNNNFVTSNTLLKQGDSLKVLAFDQGIDYQFQSYPLTVVYEDDFILIVNKPINTAIYPEDKNGLNTLCNYVANYYLETNQYIPVRHIHRLDKDTTGLVMFCKCAFLQPKLDIMMANKEIKRTYLAIVDGIVKKDLIINKPISRDCHQNRMRTSNNGKKAVTKVHVLKTDFQNNYTVVKCDLQTGRKHQIRVHLSSINHPLLSDPLYGTNSKLINRVALHGYKLEFNHPFFNQKITVFADIPDDMKFIGKIDLQ